MKQEDAMKELFEKPSEISIITESEMPEIVRRGYIYIGHLPDGAYEPQLRKFFTQFGKIKKVRVSRSSKSGHSRGYAFLMFESEPVAKIAAETMHGRLMFGKVLECKQIPQEDIHPNTFKRVKKSSLPSAYGKRASVERITERQKVSAKKRNKGQPNKKRISERLQKKKQRLTDLGINYDPPKL